MTCDRNVYHDVVERNEYDLPGKFKARDVIIDIGAHIGSFSFACLQRGAAHVLSYEAELENFKLARSHLLEYAGRVSVHHAAVWRSDTGDTMLKHSGYSDAGHEINTGGGNVIFQSDASSAVPSVVKADKSSRHDQRVPTIALDSILKKHKTVRLLKLDCEGSEWPILLTSSELKRVEVICGEYHEIGSLRNSQPIPEIAKVPGYDAYSEEVLVRFLSSMFSDVWVRRHGESELGLFWARK